MAVPRQWIHNYTYNPEKPSVAQQNIAQAEAGDDNPTGSAMSSLKKMLAQKPGKASGASSPLSVSLSKKKKKGVS